MGSFLIPQQESSTTHTHHRPPTSSNGTTATKPKHTHGEGGGGGFRRRRIIGGGWYRRSLLASILTLQLYSVRRVVRFHASTNEAIIAEKWGQHGLRHHHRDEYNHHHGHVLPPTTAEDDEHRAQVRGDDVRKNIVTVGIDERAMDKDNVTDGSSEDDPALPLHVAARPPPPEPDPSQQRVGSKAEAAAVATLAAATDGRKDGTPPSRATPQAAAPEVKFFDDETRDVDEGGRGGVGVHPPPSCRLDPLHGLRYVGCGMDGHAYEARLDCAAGAGDDVDVDGNGGGVVDDQQRQPQSQRRNGGWGRRGRRGRGRAEDHGRRVVVKVLTVKVDPTSKAPGPRRYASERFDEINTGDGGAGRNVAELYRRIVGPPAPVVGGDDIDVTTTGDVGDGTVELLDVQRHFALPMGTVDVPLAMLHGALDDIRREGSRHMRCRYDVVLRPHAEVEAEGEANAESVNVTAKVMPLSEGEAMDIDALRSMDPRSRRDIVGDIIAMHRHMFLRGVIHCDIRLEHYMYHYETRRRPHHPISERDGGNATAARDADTKATVTLIDYERHRYRIHNNPDHPGKARRRRRQADERYRTLLHKQLWQVLAVIGTVCNPYRPDGSSFEIPNNVCVRRDWDQPLPGDVLPGLREAFRRCGFVGGEMEFLGPGYGDGGDDGGNEKKTAASMMMMSTNDTARMYDALSTWSRGIGSMA